MTKICHLTNIHKWNDTRIFYKECVSLANEGFDVSLIAPNAPTDTVNGVKVIGVEVSNKSRYYRLSVLAWKVFRAGLKTKSKIYHFHDPEMIWVGILLRLLGKKVIYDVHENVGAQILDKKWLVFPKLFAFIYAIAEFLASKLFHIVIAEDSYEEIYAGKANSITKVLNYPDLNQFAALRNTKVSDKNGILYVGLVSRLRGIFEIIAALKDLKEQGIDFHFHCVGPMFDNLKAEIEADENYQFVKDQITFYGPMPVYEAYQLVKDCKLGLSILHPVPNYLRSFSTKIFEYMALGLPFIVSDFEIYRFVKEQNLGQLIDPLSVADLTKSMKRILNEEINLEEVRNRSIEASAAFSWDVQAQNLIQLYRQIS